MRITRAAWLVAAALLTALGAALLTASPVGAQEEPTTPEPPRQVDISFDIGPYDSTLDDFLVTAVIVRGDGQEGQPVGVEVRDRSGRVIWSGETSFTPPEVRIPVNPPIPVADVGSASLSQAFPVVEAEQFIPPEVSHAVEGGAGGSGQLALSMVLIVALVALLFRSPLPSSTAQRWTR